MNRCLPPGVLAASIVTLASAQNDECVGALPVFADTPQTVSTVGFTVSPEPRGCSLGPPLGADQRDLWYSYTTSLDQSIVTVTTDPQSGVLAVVVEWYAGDCGSLMAETCGVHARFLSQQTSFGSDFAGTTYLLRIAPSNGTTLSFVVTETPLCPTPPEDPEEDGDTCQGARRISDGVYDDLNVDDSDPDFYAVRLGGGDTLTVDCGFVHAHGDIDLYLWSPDDPCGSEVAGTGAGSGALAVSLTADDDEQIVYTNPSVQTVSLIVEVRTASSPACNAYRLSVDGSSGVSTSLGDLYCASNPNSTGVRAIVSGIGSIRAADNRLTLEATHVPRQTSVIFLTSRTPGRIPNPIGHDGILCFGGGIGRFIGPGEIQFTGPTNSARLDVDLTSVPEGVGFTSVVPGDVWRFQGWFRDVRDGQATSNFTDALAIRFQ